MRSEPIDPAGIEWTRVSPRYLLVRVVGWAAATAGFTVLACVPLLLRLTDLWRTVPAALAWSLPAAVVLVAAVRGALMWRQVRAIGYAERNEDLLIRSGVLFQRTMVVPYGRMQYVDIAVGPVERALGLCTVKLHTASTETNAVIPGVPALEGARLREQLSARGEARLAGL